MPAIIHRLASVRCALDRGGLALLALVWLAMPAAAQYTLQPGDTLQVAAAGVPEFNATATVNIDGEIDLPLVGTLEVAGLTLEATRRQIRTRASETMLTRRLPSGQEVGTVIEPNEVTVAIAEYRPVYVDGDVSAPGEQSYRPGLTVRQALAKAGGVSLVRQATRAPAGEVARLRGEYDRARADLARLLVREARIKAELEGQRTVPAPNPERQVDPELTARLQPLQTTLLNARNQQLAANKASIDRSIALLEQRLVELDQRLTREREAAERDEAMVRSMQEGVRQRVVANTRLADAQSRALATAARVQEVGAQIARTKQEIEELTRRRDNFDDERTVTLLDDATAVAAEIAAARSQVRGLAEQMMLQGASAGTVVNRERSISITVYRGTPAEPMPAEGDMDLRPGDVVDVTLETFAADG